MKLTLLSLGAGSISLVLGAVAGESINTVPKTSGMDVLEAIPRHDLVFSPAAPDQGISPDHYPLVTPRGRVEVEDLWLHGLYRNRRPADVLYDFELEPGPSELELAEEAQTGDLDEDVQRAVLSEEDRSLEAGAEPEPVTPVVRAISAHVAANEPTRSAGVHRQGGLKIIDVAAALAHDQHVLRERP